MAARFVARAGGLCLVAASALWSVPAGAAPYAEAFAKVTVDVQQGIRVTGDQAPRVTIGGGPQETSWARAMALSGWNISEHARALKTRAQGGGGTVEYYGSVEPVEGGSQVWIYAVTWPD